MEPLGPAAAGAPSSATVATLAGGGQSIGLAALCYQPIRLMWEVVPGNFPVLLPFSCSLGGWGLHLGAA